VPREAGGADALATPVIFGPGRRFVRLAWKAALQRSADMGHLLGGEASMSEHGSCGGEPHRDEATAPDTVAATQALVENHRAFLGFLEKRVGSRALAEDLLQDAFAKGLDRLDELREGESTVAWFYRVLRNAVIDHWRRSDVKARRLETFAAELRDAVEAPPEVLAVACQCVNRLAVALKPEYAEALRRIEVDGVSVKDFAAEVGISPGNAAVRVFRARDALRKQVVRSCGTCAESATPTLGRCKMKTLMRPWPTKLCTPTSRLIVVVDGDGDDSPSRAVAVSASRCSWPSLWDPQARG